MLVLERGPGCQTVQRETEPAHPKRSSLIGRARCQSQPDSDHVTDVFVISLPPSLFSPCHVDVRHPELTGCGAKISSATLPEHLTRVTEHFPRLQQRLSSGVWEPWRTGNGRRCCPSSTTGPTASLPGAACMDIRRNHRVCPLFCLTGATQVYL